MLKRNLIANYLGQGWTALVGLAFIPLYIKYLGIEAYGLIGLFGVIQA
jgi:O-antigen/teichoic acid export membrane protein